MPRRASCQMPRQESCSASQASPSAAAPAFSRCTTPARPPESTPSAFASTTRASSAGQVPSPRSRGTIPARRRGLVERRDEDDTNRTISTTTTTLTRTAQRIPSHEDSHSHTPSPSASSAVPPRLSVTCLTLPLRAARTTGSTGRHHWPFRTWPTVVVSEHRGARQRRVLLLLPECPQGSAAARLPAAPPTSDVVSGSLILGLRLPAGGPGEATCACERATRVVACPRRAARERRGH
jgi:hypothetical protein